MNEQSKNAELIKFLGISLVPIHLFFYYYPLSRANFKIQFLDHIYVSLIEKLPMLKSSLFVNVLAVIILLIYAITTPLGKNKELDRKVIVKNTLLGVCLVVLSILIFYLLPYTDWGFYIYVSLLCVAYYFYISHIVLFLQVVQISNVDTFNWEKETFPQMIEKIETPFSVNIPYYFFFEGKWHRGWLNFVNPFRAILVAGSPGSGKSFGTINLAIHQLIHKGFCLYVYDFKIPTLALEVFNGLWHYKELLKQEYGSIEQWERLTKKKFPKYYQIDLKNPMKTHRINPISSNLILEVVDATESAKFIMEGLSGSKGGGDGGNKFFDQSAENLLTACIYYLKRKSNQYGQEFCSLPHVVELLQRPYELLFPLLMSDPYVRNIASTFQSAFDKEVFEQLQGQVDSLKIPMGQLSDPNIYWVFTGEDFNINISNPENPACLVIGNDPDREETYGVLLSLLNGKLTKTINKKNQLPLGVIIDELPTLPFNSINNLIATARSNKVACILGIQDTSQFVHRYGQEKANMIINMVGSVVTGQIRGELAKTVSECIGKINQEQVSESLSAQGISYSISNQLNEAVTVSTIANLSQGEMVGTISDDFSAPLKFKRFHGRVDALAHEASPTTQMPIKEIPALNMTFELKENETEEQRKQRVQIIVRQNYEKVKSDLVLLQFLEIIRYQFQKKEGIEINLEVLAENMLKYIMTINHYVSNEGLSPQGEKFMDKLEIMNELFQQHISTKIALCDEESRSFLVNDSVIEPKKKTYFDYNSTECQDLQAHYREFFQVFLSDNLSNWRREEREFGWDE
ncbi:type IV secretory system conjugative DNA transfer family protein [Arcicella sp. LKC2W]|uniref:type IV secretory system conjugative DNA transfer family protein n=1 Tax=Arcicella sp. LKC2W TaxID=2984198 RepID=UPI002B1EB14A|nr:type IV secretory system conjugative DNA transfer family protein [Arcicella sp. LKC2W]MEA5461646.1 type IV secretory system conjugative DNA transfer family protein [Arcicella sp. LKC2W]